MSMTDEDRAFLTEVAETLKRFIRESRDRQLTTLGYLLEMALLEARGQSRK